MTRYQDIGVRFTSRESGPGLDHHRFEKALSHLRSEEIKGTELKGTWLIKFRRRKAGQALALFSSPGSLFRKLRALPAQFASQGSSPANRKARVQTGMLTRFKD